MTQSRSFASFKPSSTSAGCAHCVTRRLKYRHGISAYGARPYAPEEAGVKPVPIFINGVEAHTVVRDLLTTEHEQARRAAGVEEIDSLLPDAAVVDAVVSTVGFPLVGGPAGSMEAGRQAEVGNREPLLFDAQVEKPNRRSLGRTQPSDGR
jgi:hypothetical protein